MFSKVITLHGRSTKQPFYELKVTKQFKQLGRIK